MPGKMSQKEFADKLREKLPELQDFTDSQIVSRILKMRPELSESIDTGNDEAAAKEQAKLEKRSRSIIDPESWTNPTAKGFAKGVLDALPGAGAILGGAAATPETLGGGTIAGGALGAGAGRGLRDLATQYLGLEDTTPGQKAKNIAMDTGIAAVAPGAMTIAKYPVQAARMAASDLMGLEGLVVPKALRPFVTPGFLEKVAGPMATKTPISDPIASRTAEMMEEGLGPQIMKSVGRLPKPTPQLSLPEGDLSGKYLGYLEQELPQLGGLPKGGVNTGPSDNLYDLWKIAGETASKVTKGASKAASDPLKTLESKVIQQSSKRGGWKPTL